MCSLKPGDRLLYLSFSTVSTNTLKHASETGVTKAYFRYVIMYLLLKKSVMKCVFCRIHICVTHAHTQPGLATRFVSDVREATNDCLKDTDGPVQGKVSRFGL